MTTRVSDMYIHASAAKCICDMQRTESGTVMTHASITLRFISLYAASSCSSFSFTACSSDSETIISYPAPFTASAMTRGDVRSGFQSIVAELVAKFTSAVMTPGQPDIALLTVPAHTAHIMPVTGKVSCLISFLFAIGQDKDYWRGCQDF